MPVFLFKVSYFLETFLRGHEVVIPSLYKRLCDIREKYESVPFFKSHEVGFMCFGYSVWVVMSSGCCSEDGVGVSSLLIIYDSSNQARVWMTDFDILSSGYWQQSTYHV